MRQYVSIKGGNVMYTIDTKSNEKHFIVTDPLGKAFKVAKDCNTLEDVKKLVGLIHIKKII